MNQKEERIQYLTGKAQRGVISPNERQELANLLGRNPGDFNNEDGLKTLVGIALVAIAIALIADVLGKK
jgi:hypothetical protein